MDAEGPEKFVFGAEESLGYLAGSYCRDKDATIAALYVLECAAELKLEGKTLLDRLDELYCEHGYHIEGQTSKVCEGPTGRDQIVSLIDTFRTAPPTELAGISLTRVRDYGTHEIRTLPANEQTESLPQPEGNVLFFESGVADDGFNFSIAVRPSGTEPKIKFYYFAKAPCESSDRLATVKSTTTKRMGEIQTALSSWIDAGTLRVRANHGNQSHAHISATMDNLIMTTEKIGIWLIGAWGGVSTTTAVGLAALQLGITKEVGLVTALPAFADLKLADWSEFTIGGHEIRQTTVLS